MGDLCENAEEMERRLRAEADRNVKEAMKRMDEAQKKAEEAEKKLRESCKEILSAMLEMCMNELALRQKLKEIGRFREES